MLSGLDAPRPPNYSEVLGLAITARLFHELALQTMANTLEEVYTPFLKESCVIKLRNKWQWLDNDNREEKSRFWLYTCIMKVKKRKRNVGKRKQIHCAGVHSGVDLDVPAICYLWSAFVNPSQTVAPLCVTMHWRAVANHTMITGSTMQTRLQKRLI